MTKDEIRAIKDKHSKTLMPKHGLTGIGVGHKRVAGQHTDQLAVVFMVEKKLPKDKVEADKLLPETLDGAICDVIETGKLTAKATYSGVVRPAMPGFSVGHYLVTAGTLGCVVYDNNGNRYI